MKTTKRVFFVHWNADEAKQRLVELKRRDLVFEWSDLERGTSSADYKRLREEPPAIVLIDLTRLPSHGKEVAVVLRQSKKTFFLPIVFVGGTPEKVESVRSRVPDAIYCAWDDVHAALDRALTHPPLPSRQVPETCSSKPIAAKLGIRDGSAILVIGGPNGFFDLLGELPTGASLEQASEKIPRRGSFDVIVFFTKQRRELADALAALEARLAVRGGLWIAWPKKASKVPTDITEDVLREIVLPKGLVDNKVCAVDAVWSGLRFARRQK